MQLASLSGNMVAASQDQPMKALLSPYKIGISQCQSSQRYTQAQQMQASLPADMFDVPKDQP